VQDALQWLENNQDTPLDELQRASAEESKEDEEMSGVAAAPVEGGGVAKSLVCNECGKKFRSTDAAEFHATKS
jgi:UBX domain-containing protein 1/4